MSQTFVDKLTKNGEPKSAIFELPCIKASS